jgi:hypothetical protein
MFLTGGDNIFQSPPWIEKLDKIRTSVLRTAHINGIHVDILNFPASYTAPRLPGPLFIEYIPRTYNCIVEIGMFRYLHKPNNASR